MKILQFSCDYTWYDWNQLQFGIVKNERVYYLSGKDRKPWNFTYIYDDFKYTLIYYNEG